MSNSKGSIILVRMHSSQSHGKTLTQQAKKLVYLFMSNNEIGGIVPGLIYSSSLFIYQQPFLSSINNGSFI
jgi:hypothetical protein